MDARQVPVLVVEESSCDMPVLESAYKAPFYLRNKHLSTVLLSLFRKVEGVDYKRERINTPDDDFLDLDWVETGADRLMIVLHGLEGSSERHYSKGVVKYFVAHGWDGLAWNARGCSGEMNKQPRMYHHADIADLETTIEYALHKKNYKDLVLVGSSMGGAIVLNYLIHTSKPIPKQLRAAVAISAPIDVGGSAKELEKPGNSFYLNRFMSKLKEKMKEKAIKYPELIDVTGLDDIKLFSEFDNRYTAPLHGFKSADDFYSKASSKNFLDRIKIPTLLMIAEDDPFMPESCYPFDQAKTSEHLYIEVPKYGGHVGFPWKGIQSSWMEIRALEFVENFI